jgi:hypothetical protein
MLSILVTEWSGGSGGGKRSRRNLPSVSTTEGGEKKKGREALSCSSHSSTIMPRAGRGDKTRFGSSIKNGKNLDGKRKRKKERGGKGSNANRSDCVATHGGTALSEGLTLFGLWKGEVVSIEGEQERRRGETHLESHGGTFDESCLDFGDGVLDLRARRASQ